MTMKSTLKPPDLQPGIDVSVSGGIHYLLDDRGKKIRPKAWLGDLLSIFYDRIMQNSVFPRQLSADMDLHYKILSGILQDFQHARVLELAAGSGSAVNFLPNSCYYTGSDVSPGLLKQASHKLKNTGFINPVLFAARAEDIPFAENSFDLCLCVLAMNFFDDLPTIISKTMDMLVPGGSWVGCVPVPERNHAQRAIHGTLYSEKELEKMFRGQNFVFTGLPEANGALLYFHAESMK
ncbi:MAG: class I SAM-dependent methyltransferase [Anaerolineales bacterium]|nr:class I SAM-dependent methyltransferase [Anaerolineales bacterium]